MLKCYGRGGYKLVFLFARLTNRDFSNLLIYLRGGEGYDLKQKRPQPLPSPQLK